MDVPQFNNSSTEGHLSSFWFGAKTNKIAMNIHAQVLHGYRLNFPRINYLNLECNHWHLTFVA